MSNEKWGEQIFQTRETDSHDGAGTYSTWIIEQLQEAKSFLSLSQLLLLVVGLQPINITG